MVIADVTKIFFRNIFVICFDFSLKHSTFVELILNK